LYASKSALPAGIEAQTFSRLDLGAGRTEGKSVSLVLGYLTKSNDAVGAEDSIINSDRRK
jgi:hypothetical protein